MNFNNFNTIINPLTNEKISIFSNKGIQLLKHYIKQYKSGGEKKWNTRRINIVKKRVKDITIPKGTILFRAQTNKTLEPNECEDTGKVGLYFGDGKIIPLGMILEYDTPKYICKYRVLEDINVDIGKYSFRLKEPKRFFRYFDDVKKPKCQKSRQH